MAASEKPKYDKNSPEYLAFNQAGHLGEREDNAYVFNDSVW